MFDTTFLQPADLEFVVIADTHYMLDPGDRPLEFESRRKQTARAETALQLVADLDPAFVVHMGDLSQEYPEAERFQDAIQEAREQLERCGIHPHHVAGNHDVGDKTDPTMPTHPVTPESLALYHQHLGPSWYSFDHDEIHVIVINSQILNTALPETEEQWSWLEQDLSTHADKRIFLFLHLPPYLGNASEPYLGHYDNIAQPDRSRLLNLVRKYPIEHLSAAHVHFAFFDRIGQARYYIVPSPSFTRPGFSHLFESEAPPEHGRDDTGKLGFHLVRVFPNRTDIHFIRTRGDLAPTTAKRLVTRTSASLPDSPLGLTLRRPLTPINDVPIAYPSSVRQPVRNDYPFLSCLELGATSVRIPWTDLEDPFQSQRLQWLQEEGVHLTATFLDADPSRLTQALQQHGTQIDTWEIQLPGTPFPTHDILHILSEHQATFCLAPVIPGERIAGKQHPRTRTGYLLEELDPLDHYLASENGFVDRILCRIDAGDSPWDIVHRLQNRSPLARIKAIDLALELPSLNDQENASRLAEACFAIALLPGSRLYVDPLIDFDRTMDIQHGLLDTRCNPRPPFHIFRCLNTLLFHNGINQYASQPKSDLKTLTTPHQTFHLILPNMPTGHLAFKSPFKVYDLQEGIAVPPESLEAPQGPLLVLLS
ncbi:MAG: metallophosphoesterase [bacterium]|nr:metallophosphoesterase [bacterium]